MDNYIIITTIITTTTNKWLLSLWHLAWCLTKNRCSIAVVKGQCPNTVIGNQKLFSWKIFGMPLSYCFRLWFKEPMMSFFYLRLEMHTRISDIPLILWLSWITFHTWPQVKYQIERRGRLSKCPYSLKLLNQAIFELFCQISHSSATDLLSG